MHMFLLAPGALRAPNRNAPCMSRMVTDGSSEPLKSALRTCMTECFPAPKFLWLLSVNSHSEDLSKCIEETTSCFGICGFFFSGLFRCDSEGCWACIPPLLWVIWMRQRQAGTPAQSSFAGGKLLLLPPTPGRCKVATDPVVPEFTAEHCPAQPCLRFVSQLWGKFEKLFQTFLSCLSGTFNLDFHTSHSAPCFRELMRCQPWCTHHG